MTQRRTEQIKALPDVIPNNTEKDTEYDDVGQNELYVKCLNGSLEEIKKCLESGDVNREHTTNGQTPLHAVVSSGRPDATQIIDILVKYGFDVDAVTKPRGYTALHLAIKYQSLHRALKLVLKLKDCNASLAIKDKKGRTPYDCAISRNLRRVAILLDPTCVMSKDEVDAQYLQVMKEYYGPRLIEAVMDSNELKIKECIENHADPNAINKYGAGAIHYAVTHCTLPVVETIKRLLKVGADINLRDAEGDNVLNIVLKSDRFLEDTERLDVVTNLMELGAKSTIEDQNGEDALAIAEDMKYTEIIELLKRTRPKVQLGHMLLTAGLRVGEAGVPGEYHRIAMSTCQLPYSITHTMHNSAMVDKGRTRRIMSIISEGNFDVLTDIVKETDAVNVRGEGGNYPIHMAVAAENDVTRALSVVALLQAGADINVKNKNGNTCLHMAVLNSQPETVAQLLLYGAETHIKNYEGKTAEDIAELQFDVVIMSMFEKADDIEEKKKNRLTHP